MIQIYQVTTVYHPVLDPPGKQETVYLSAKDPSRIEEYQLSTQQKDVLNTEYYTALDPPVIQKQQYTIQLKINKVYRNNSKLPSYRSTRYTGSTNIKLSNSRSKGIHELVLTTVSFPNTSILSHNLNFKHCFFFLVLRIHLILIWTVNHPALDQKDIQDNSKPPSSSRSTKYTGTTVNHPALDPQGIQEQQ